MLYGFYFDPTYILIIIGMVLCLAASAHVNSTFNKYSRVRSNSGMTGAQAAQRILESQGIYEARSASAGSTRGPSRSWPTCLQRRMRSRSGSPSRAALENI